MEVTCTEFGNESSAKKPHFDSGFDSHERSGHGLGSPAYSKKKGAHKNRTSDSLLFSLTVY